MRIAARGLTFRYGAEPVLDDWSAEFDEGSCTAITGASGRGKSTLLYLIGLMVSPHGGSLCMDGFETVGLSDAIRARIRAHNIGFVFQDAVLDANRTVVDNITESALYRGVRRRDEEDHAIRLMGAFDVDVEPGSRPSQLSGGQAQRIALCRALLHRPALVLADEPTGNLDTSTGRVVIDALVDHARSGGTVVVATHDADVVARCDSHYQL